MTDYIEEIHHKPRMHSVMIKGTDRDVASRNLQVISAHLPTLIGHDVKEAECCLRDLAEMVRGRRRNQVLMGIDANFELDGALATPGVVGKALRRGTSRSAGIDAQDISVQFVEHLRAHNMKVVNTLEEWWNLMPDKTQERYTWRGKIFGHSRAASIDFLIMDTASADSIVSTRFDQKPPAFPSDHAVLLSTTVLPGKFQPAQKCRTKKFFGWQPQDPLQYNALVWECPESRFTVTLSEMSQFLFTEAMRTTSAFPKRSSHLESMHSATGQRICAMIPDAERDSHMWEHGHTIRKDKEHARAEHVLQHMRDGRSGASHLVAPEAVMPYLLKDGQRIICTEGIRT